MTQDEILKAMRDAEPAWAKDGLGLRGAAFTNRQSAAELSLNGSAFAQREASVVVHTPVEVSVDDIASPVADAMPGEGGTSLSPWDIYAINTENNTCKVWPGAINNMMQPSNMAATLSMGGDYLVATVNASGFGITSVTLGFEGSVPPPHAPTKEAPVSSFKILLGGNIDGVIFNLWKKSLSVVAAVAGETPRENPGPFEARWEKWYIWEVR